VFKIEPKFMHDNTGKKIGIVLSIKTFEKLINKLEDIEDYEYIQKYGEKKTKVFSLDEVINEIKKRNDTRK